MIEEPKVKLKRYLSHPVTVDNYVYLVERQTDTRAHTIVSQKLKLSENVLFWFQLVWSLPCLVLLSISFVESLLPSLQHCFWSGDCLGFIYCFTFCFCDTGTNKLWASDFWWSFYSKRFQIAFLIYWLTDWSINRLIDRSIDWCKNSATPPWDQTQGVRQGSKCLGWGLRSVFLKFSLSDSGLISPYSLFCTFCVCKKRVHL